MSKLCVTGLSWGESTGDTGRFPLTKGQVTRNVSIWWRYHLERNSSGSASGVLRCPAGQKFGPPSPFSYLATKHKIIWPGTVSCLNIFPPRQMGHGQHPDLKMDMDGQWWPTQTFRCYDWFSHKTRVYISPVRQYEIDEIVVSIISSVSDSGHLGLEIALNITRGIVWQPTVKSLI